MKKEEELFRRCPTCLGAGKVMVGIQHRIYTPEIRTKARSLYRQGMSLREIGKRIGVEHPQRVISLIKARL